MRSDKQNININKITAKGIIEKYDYTINFDKTSNKLKAIYAENGHGKTNLLKTLDYLTSKDQDEFKNIFYLPFKEIHIETTEGKVSCYKESRKVCSVYTEKTNESPIKEDINLSELKENIYFDEDNSKNDNITYIKYNRVFKSIRQIIGDVIFLGTDRLSDVESSFMLNRGRRPMLGYREIYDRYSDPSGYIVGQTLVDLSSTLGHKAQIASAFSKGNRGVYATVVRSILRSSESQHNSTSDAKDAMDKKILEIKNSMKLVNKYGLMNFSEFHSIADSISQARKNHKKFVDLSNILIPYFDSIEERIQNMLPAAILIDAFINAINTMFSGLKIEYNIRSVRNKFEIKHKNTSYGDKEDIPDDKLDPNVLSSGEKHLLLLLAQVILSATRGDTLLLVDEPEISLGIPWQKVLVKHIEEFSKASGLQIIMATHSPIILEDYMPEDIIVSNKYEKGI